MGAGRKIRISQCMIVKDEEKNIERALSWGKDIMWEQIVVDTGSSDRTVELAEKAGAKVCYFPWTDDFAAAKNYAIEQVSGDWIAFLDADEYMRPEDAGKLLKVLEQLPEGRFDGISTGWQQLDDEGSIFSSGTQIRFFKKDPDIRYRRRIHEQLERISGRELHVGDVTKELSIFHTGYQKEAMEKKGREGRNRRLIRRELEDHPDDYEMLGYMGDECMADGEAAQAEKWYRRAVLHMPEDVREDNQRAAVSFTRLLMLLSDKEETQPEEILSVYARAVEAFPKEADFDYISGRFYAKRGRAGEAAVYLETAVNKLEAYGCNNKALLLAGNLLEAYGLLVKCCYEAGELEKCVNYGVQYLRYNKYGMDVLSRVLRSLLPDIEEHSFRGQQANQAVFDFLSNLYDGKDLKDRLFLVKSARMSDRADFAAYAAERLFTPTEREKLKDYI